MNTIPASHRAVSLSHRYRNVAPNRVAIGLFLGLTFVLCGCTALPALEIGVRQAEQQIEMRLRRSSSGLRAPAVTVDVSDAVEPPLDLAIASTNRLLVVGVDGNLFTIAPEGGERYYLTNDANAQQIYAQPTWSSTGERIAWSSITRRGGGVQGMLVTATANGLAQTNTPTRFPPFYLFWSPDDSQVAYLSNWLSNRGPTIALHVANVREATVGKQGIGTAVEVDPVGVGRPFYFSWAPSSDQMVAHIDNQEVLLFNLAENQRTALVEKSANFAAPQWFAIVDDATAFATDGPFPAISASGLLYVVRDDNTAQLVMSDEQGGNELLITPLAQQDFLSFSMNALGSHVAFIETTEMVGFNSFGPLFLYDLTDELFEQLSTEPALAFFWSPDGTALYFLTVEPEDGQPWLQVNIWNGERVQRFARFIPSPSFARDYLPFADQYMQSMRFWSPDSQAIVYVGQAEDGTAGVWVQPVEEGKAPFLVAPGTFATWSPR